MQVQSPELTGKILFKDACFIYMHLMALQKLQILICNVLLETFKLNKLLKIALWLYFEELLKIHKQLHLRQSHRGS